MAARSIKNKDDLVVFVFEHSDPDAINKSGFDMVNHYLNQDTSKTVKVIPILTGRKAFYCVYPVVPNQEIIELITKAAKMDNDEISSSAKLILRSLKLMKLMG